MTTKTTFLTKDGKMKLEERLSYLSSVRRQEVAERIKAAIALGDLSENSEYEDAKNEQAFLEGEIMSIESTLRHAVLINEKDIDGKTVIIGARVKVKDKSSKKEIEYMIVGSDEADPFTGRISNESPIGKALIGKNINDVVEVDTPGGVKEFQIIAINA